MSSEAAEELKVCRTCSSVALAAQERCASCKAINWGYMPESLASRVDRDALLRGEGPVKLAGYRSLDWPPRDLILRSQELTSIPERDPDSAALAASLPSILGIWGLGHIYAGKTLQGLLLTLVGISSWVVFVVLTLAWHHGAIAYGFLSLGALMTGWQTYRAFNAALERNKLRDKRWALLRRSLGDRRGVSEYDPGRL